MQWHAVVLPVWEKNREQKDISKNLSTGHCKDHNQSILLSWKGKFCVPCYFRSQNNEKCVPNIWDYNCQASQILVQNQLYVPSKRSILDFVCFPWRVGLHAISVHISPKERHGCHTFYTQALHIICLRLERDCKFVTVYLLLKWNMEALKTEALLGWNNDN